MPEEKETWSPFSSSSSSLCVQPSTTLCPGLYPWQYPSILAGLLVDAAWMFLWQMGPFPLRCVTHFILRSPTLPSCASHHRAPSLPPSTFFVWVLAGTSFLVWLAQALLGHVPFLGKGKCSFATYSVSFSLNWVNFCCSTWKRRCREDSGCSTALFCRDQACQ